MKLNQFEYKHNQFAKAMKQVDPTIKLIASGAMPDTMTGSKESLNLGTNLVPTYLSPADWTGGLLSNCFDNIDLISEHFYNYGGTHFSLAEGRQVPNDPNEPITDWMRRPANHIRIKYEEYKEYEKLIPALVAHPKPLNIDEWAYSSRGGSVSYPVYPSYAWVFHEMFRHSDIFQMAAYTFATSLLARNGTNVSLNANGLVFKIYRDHFGTIPVEVSGNSPQPKPTDPPGGEQPVVNAGSDTFPLDVAAAWTEDHRALTVAVLNPTDVEQPLKLNITGADLSGKGTLWRLASTESDGQNPSISSSPVDSDSRFAYAAALQRQHLRTFGEVNMNKGHGRVAGTRRVGGGYHLARRVAWPGRIKTTAPRARASSRCASSFRSTSNMRISQRLWNTEFIGALWPTAQRESKLTVGSGISFLAVGSENSEKAAQLQPEQRNRGVLCVMRRDARWEALFASEGKSSGSDSILRYQGGANRLRPGGRTGALLRSQAARRV